VRVESSSSAYKIDFILNPRTVALAGILSERLLLKNRYIDRPFAERLTDICWFAGIGLSALWTTLEVLGVLPYGSSDLAARVGSLVFFVLAALLALLCGSRGRLIWCVVCAVASLAWCFAF